MLVVAMNMVRARVAPARSLVAPGARAMIARRVWLVALLAYIALDLNCPFVPGAFQFDPSQSVDAATAYRNAGDSFRTRPSVEPQIAAEPSLPASTIRSGPATERHGTERASLEHIAWRPHVARHRGLVPEPHPPTVDG